ncbi:MAG: hypothetical protein QF506_04635 [Candidatus Woesearchaeota archaeon]|jgi:hypothetical protein|nr:hypothetical protein [Candidatus Woesearchaeota archaeon]
MRITKFFRDYRECRRTEKEIESLMQRMCYPGGYKTTEEGDNIISEIYELIDKAKELNKTISAGVLGYIPTKRLYEGTMRLEQQLGDNWLLAYVPVEEESVSDKVLQSSD